MMDPESTGERAPFPSTAECVIIGGGIVGASIALFLARAGMRAILLEGEAGLGSRTTAMSAHCIRAQFSEPENIRMMAESLAFYERFAEQVGIMEDHSPIGLRQQGYLFASTDPGDHVAFRDRVSLQRQAGLNDVHVLDGDTVHARFPWLSDRIVTATWRERDGWIDSITATRLMARASGVPVHLDTRVREIVVERGRVTGVSTVRGVIATDNVILAAGPMSATLSPDPLPLRLKRRHRLIVPPDPRIPQDGPVLIDANTGAHWRPHAGGALLAWARKEPDAAPTWPVQPDPAFADLVLHNPGGVGRLAPFWQELADDGVASSSLLTAGQYTLTPDHRPLIGPAPRTQGLWLNTGYSGHGIMGAPAGARLLADLMKQASPEANPFAPDRFTDATLQRSSETLVI